MSAKNDVFTILEDDQVLVSNGLIGIELDKEGFGLRGVHNLITRRSFILPTIRPTLWEAQFRDAIGASYVITNNAKCETTYRVEKTADELKLHLKWSGIDLIGESGSGGTEKGVVDIEVTLTLTRDSSLSYWRIKVDNGSLVCGLWDVTFPKITNLRTLGEEPCNDHLVLPSGWGILLKNPSQAQELAIRSYQAYFGMEPEAQFTYPGGRWVMQFVAFYNGESGLYAATHDPEACHKVFQTPPNPDVCTVNIEIKNYPEGMLELKGGYEMPYDVVIGVFKGDWYTAATIYREWVLRNGPWCTRGPVSKRKDIPEWFKEVSLWCRPSRISWGDPDKVVPDVLKFTEYFGVPTALHWYNWHRIPFDTDYPEYFPVKDGFKEGVRKLQEAGVRVMPYINGRLFDPNCESWSRDGAEKYCAKLCSPRVGSKSLYKYLEYYGSRQNFAVMCPFTEYWQDKVAGIVERLVGEYEVDGVYIDQIAAAPSNLCFDPDHGHAAGGGGFWVDGYEKLLEKTRKAARAKNPEMIMTTESNAEPYMGYLDGYLMCNSTRGNLIPLFPAVYGGYTITFGRYIFEDDLRNPVSFRMKIGEMFVFGAQLGWFGLYEITEDQNKAEAEYLKRLARCYGLARKYLMFGEMLHPPKPETDLMKVSAKWGRLGFTHDVCMPSVLSSAWKAEDATVGLILTNISESSQVVTYLIDTAEYGLPKDKRYVVSRLTEKGTETIATYATSEFKIKEIIPSKSALVIQIKAE